MIEFAFDKEENILGEEENAGYQHFFFSQNISKRHLPHVLLKHNIMWRKVK